MPFKKGKSGNPNGKKPGTLNKNVDPIRLAFNKLITSQLPNIRKDLESLEPKDRLIMIDKLSEYCIPKQQRIEMKAEVTGELVTTQYVIDLTENEKVTVAI